MAAGVGFTSVQVRSLLGLDLADADDSALAGATAAAVVYVERLRADLDVWPADVQLGVAMLAHRWYMRRGTPLGPPEYGEFAGTSVLRHDPDIAKLLGVGSSGRVVFGAPPRTDPEYSSPYWENAPWTS